MVGAKSATEPLGRIMKKPSLAGTSLLAYAFALRSVACTSPSPSPPLGGDERGGGVGLLVAQRPWEAQGGASPGGLIATTKRRMVAKRTFPVRRLVQAAT